MRPNWSCCAAVLFASIGLMGCGTPPHVTPPDAGLCAKAPPPTDGGIGYTGGQVEHLYFAVVGDTRPNNADQTAQYPTQIVNKIYADIACMNPKPQFVVATGDFMFANPGGTQQMPQLNLYTAASHQFEGPLFPVMGNHECTGNTDSNCAGAPTANMTAFMNTLLAPVGSTTPYYTVKFSANDNSWTAKLVVLACNAWDQTQLAWAQNQLGQQTTYTLIARHEGQAAANSPPCITDADPLLNQYPYDVFIAGHSHLFSTYSKQVIVGTGGAPLDSASATYGYAIIEEQGGNFSVTEYDYNTASPIRSYTFPH